MMFVQSVLIIYCSYFLSVSTAHEGSTVPLCEKDETTCLNKLGERLIEVLANGSEELGLPPASDIDINDNKFKNKTLTWNTWDTKAAGTDKCAINILRRCTDTSKIYLEIDCTSNVYGRYFLNGKILDIPAWGDGLIQFNSSKIKYISLLTVEKKICDDNKVHWNIINIEQDYDPINPVSYELTNMYDGDKERAQYFLDVGNKDWKYIATTVSKPFYLYIGAAIISYLKELLKKYPIEDFGITN